MFGILEGERERVWSVSGWLTIRWRKSHYSRSCSLGERLNGNDDWNKIKTLTHVLIVHSWALANGRGGPSGDCFARLDKSVNGAGRWLDNGIGSVSPGSYPWFATCASAHTKVRSIARCGSSANAQGCWSFMLCGRNLSHPVQPWR